MGLKILLIEPDRSLANIYKKFLESYHHQVSNCAGSQQAIYMIDKEVPDVIILETQLTGHDGYEFLYELRSYPEWQDISVIIHSLVPKHVVNHDFVSSTELGVKDYLYKPSCSLAKLLYSVEHFATVA